MNKKPMIMAIASLGSLALIGTGFAGWVISTEATANATGNMTAYTVTDKRIVIGSEAWQDNVNNIKFAAPNAAGQTAISESVSSLAVGNSDYRLWLTFPNEAATEVETLTTNYTVVYWSSDTAADPVITVKNKVYVGTEGYASDYATAISKGYIVGATAAKQAAPNDGKAADVDVVKDATTSPIYYTNVEVAANSADVTACADAAFKGHADGKYYKLVVYYNFNWGAVTNGTNPFAYFNTKLANAAYSQAGVTGEDFTNKSNADIAKQMLDAINLVDDTQFDLNIRLSVAA